MPEKKIGGSAKAAPKAKATAAPKAKKTPAKKPAARAASKPAAPRRGPDHVEERIQRRAYELWEREGRPDGREHDHWLQAEREVSKVRRQRTGVAR